jgi:hypothetical protein
MVILWLLCLVVVSHAAPACDTACQSAQRASLLRLYDDLQGPKWAKQQGWREQSAQYCAWQGVRCCGDTNLMAGSSLACPVAGAVAGLELPGNGLGGPWPAAALDGLKDTLVSLNLRSNQLTGPLPSSVSDLSVLSRLYIDNNKLTGPLPAALGSMANLTQLSASGNSFSGPLPASLADLTQLQWLLLDSNQLSGGVSAGVVQLPQLEVLNLQQNQLSGPLPAVTSAGTCQRHRC